METPAIDTLIDPNLMTVNSDTVPHFIYLLEHRFRNQLIPIRNYVYWKNEFDSVLFVLFSRSPRRRTIENTFAICIESSPENAHFIREQKHDQMNQKESYVCAVQIRLKMEANKGNEKDKCVSYFHR